MSCDPTPGKYNILSSVDGNAVNTCPSLAPANVAILDDATDVSFIAKEYMSLPETLPTGHPRPIPGTAVMHLRDKN